MSVNSKQAVMLSLLINMALLIGLMPAEAQPSRTPPNRKVIVSELGELTRTARYVGDSIRYRIYFANTSRRRHCLHAGVA